MRCSRIPMLAGCLLLGGCTAMRAFQRPDDASDGRILAKKPASTVSLVSTSNQVATHTVQHGETLWRISRKYNTTVQSLMALNELETPESLRSGTQLKIPGAKIVRNTRKASPQRVKGYPFVWPVDGKLSSKFGRRNGRNHDGIDIAVKEGAPIHAAASGKVLFSGRQGGYGNLIILKHSRDMVTVYAHNQQNLVRKGQHVRQGALIAKVGSTGRSTGPHVHFEVRKGVEPTNPLRYLPP